MSQKQPMLGGNTLLVSNNHRLQFQLVKTKPKLKRNQIIFYGPDLKLGSGSYTSPFTSGY
jgi:hypothetical protein